MPKLTIDIEARLAQFQDSLDADRVVQLLAKAHVAARAGRVSEARALIGAVAGYDGGDDMCLSIAALFYMVGDANESLRWLRRIKVPSGRAYQCLEAALSAIGDLAGANAAGFAANACPDKLEPCIEDCLEGPPIVNYRVPQQAARNWPPENRLLRRGEFEAAANEALRQPPEKMAKKTRSGRRLPLWRGEAVGRVAIIFWDGAGDAFFFGRYLAAIAARVDDLLVLVGAPVLPLFEQNVNGIRCRRFEHGSDELGRADAYVEMGLLPHLTGAGYGAAKWLNSPEHRPRKGATLQAGIVWNGGEYNRHDQLRSVPVTELQPLFSVPGVEWHSLQMGTKAAECPDGVRDRSPEIKDFRDTARIVAGLDVVISVDTAVANVAGAMGVPVWAMVDKDCDFRWGLAYERTPWFPCARVFRQWAAGDWGAVIENIAGELERSKNHSVFIKRPYGKSA